MTPSDDGAYNLPPALDTVQPETSKESGVTAGGILWPQGLVLFLAVALCYANSLQVPFLLDDTQPGHYSRRPLVWASFELNRALGGSDTWSFHVFNALVHLACGVLLLGVLRRGMARAAPSLAARTRDRLAFVTTLLWLCHPLQTGAVTYLSQRAEAMGALFYLLVLYAFLRSASAARPRGWQALALLALALGFATKEIIATAPLVLFLYDALFLAPGPLAALRLRRGFHGVMALVTLALASLFVAPLVTAEHSSAGFGFEQFGPLEYARTQPGVLLHYLRLAFWPHPLCFDYGWPIAAEPRDYLPQSAVVATLLVVTAVLLARRSWIGFAGACFFVILAPTSSFVPIRDPAFEHRVYLPLAVVLLLVVAGGRWLLARFLSRARRLPPVLAGATALALAATTIRRNQDYRSAVGLWQHTVELAPLNARARIHLGGALLEADRAEEAVSALLEALRLEPHNGYAYLHLGRAYLRLEQVERAIPFFERALEYVEDPRFNDYLGLALSLKGDHAGAALNFEKALAMNPSDAVIRCRLANALAQLQRPQEAVQHYREALRLAPGLQEAHGEVAALLVDLGRPSEGLEHARKALEIPPDSAEEHFNLGRALHSLGRFDEAMTEFREASRIAPDVPEPYAAFAETLCRKPDATPDERREALRLAQKANAMTDSKRPEFLESCAAAHAALGDFERAARLLEEALELPGPGRNEVLASRLRVLRDDYLRRAGR